MLNVNVRGERFALWIIAASLAVILLTSGLLLAHQVESASEQVRAEGQSLVRLLSSFSLDQLIHDRSPSGPLHVVRFTQSRADFAYVSVVSPSGVQLAEVLAGVTQVPPQSISAEPRDWHGESLLSANDAHSRIREFRAPILEQGRIVAHVRVGFFDPGYGLVFQNTPLLGMLALPVFLLAPFCLLLLRREIQPVSEASERMRSLLAGAPVQSIHADVGGTLGEFIGSFNHFLDQTRTEIDKAEEELAGTLAASRVLSFQKARIEAVLETLPDAALVLEEDGATSFANAKTSAILGVPRPEIVGNRPADWCQHKELVTFLKRYEGSRLCRSDRLEFERADESGKRIAAIAYPIISAEDGPQIPGTLVLFRDMDAVNVAQHRQTEFVSHIAHELKTPLNVLAMYAETLAGKDGESEEFRLEACNVVQDQVERLSSLIRTLLSIARIESGTVALDRQRVQLDSFLKDRLDVAARGPDALGLSFEADLPTDLAPVFIDKHLLGVAVDNLLTNAIKYNEPDGQVRLSAEDNGESIVIAVRDTGLGIDPEDQAKVFDKFYRSDDPEASSRGGHGLGLSLTRQIVELHAGRVRVRSTPGEGAEFRIVLAKTPALMRERNQL